MNNPPSVFMATCDVLVNVSFEISFKKAHAFLIHACSKELMHGEFCRVYLGMWLWVVRYCMEKINLANVDNSQLGEVSVIGKEEY